MEDTKVKWSKKSIVGKGVYIKSNKTKIATEHKDKEEQGINAI